MEHYKLLSRAFGENTVEVVKQPEIAGIGEFFGRVFADIYGCVGFIAEEFDEGMVMFLGCHERCGISGLFEGADDRPDGIDRIGVVFRSKMGQQQWHTLVGSVRLAQ